MAKTLKGSLDSAAQWTGDNAKVFGRISAWMIPVNVILQVASFLAQFDLSLAPTPGQAQGVWTFFAIVVIAGILSVGLGLFALARPEGRRTGGIGAFLNAPLLLLFLLASNALWNSLAAFSV
ncbi:hypothetical protein [Humidisolicoccus flavus]|uniref:hypothetical protein n=1 Tax=Humidisolicoccus flavus TaxID=3111414 RepID=UPI0032548130